MGRYKPTGMNQRERKLTPEWRSQCQKVGLSELTVHFVTQEMWLVKFG